MINSLTYKYQIPIGWTAFELLGKPAGLKCLVTFMSTKGNGPTSEADVALVQSLVKSQGSCAARKALQGLSAGSTDSSNTKEDSSMIDLQKENIVETKNLNSNFTYELNVSRLEKRIELAEK